MSEIEPTEQGLVAVGDTSIADLANSATLPEALRLSMQRVVDDVADDEGALSAFESFTGR